MSKKRKSAKEQSEEPKVRMLAEAAWEVCNQVGGIYTVIRSKVPVMIEHWGDDYFLLGPYVDPNVSVSMKNCHEEMCM